MANMSQPGPWMEALGRVAFGFSKIQPLLMTELHVILAALFPIIAAAHASLSRPSSAAKPEPRNKTTREDADTEDEDIEDEEDTFQRMEGFSRSDALWMPLFAGITLTGLYFLIKWLKDLDLLNKVLNWYFSTVGVFSVCKLLADALHFIHSFIFPKWYVDSRGIWRVSAIRKKASNISEVAREEVKDRSSPLPGIFAKLPVSSFARVLWTLRQLPSHKLTFKFYIHRIIALRTHISAYGVLGTILGLTATAYYNFVAKPWWLTNLMGYAFSYSALQLISPTTFDTGSLILVGLFVYDVIMVFYTPMMVTVAKSLDVPIKLLIPRPSDKPGVPAFSMLGLGDVVLPGMMIGLALRFDLYLHYLRRQISLATDGDTPKIVKARYIAPGNHWANQFWVFSWFGTNLRLPASVQTGSFSKTYFWTSITGYVVGMITTLYIMIVFNHPQPALLYLVPGVLISLWGMAFIKGDLKEMWHFTEAEEEEAKPADDGDKKRTKNKSFFSNDTMNRNEAKLKNAAEKFVQHGESASEDEAERSNTEPKAKVEQLEKSFRRDRSNDLFYFAIMHYSPLSKVEAEEIDSPKWSSNEKGEGGRAGKRLRTA